MRHETNEANLPTELMAKPVLSWEEFWDSLLGLPKSTAELVARDEPVPKFFLIGRRRYIRTADAVEWLDQAASASPYFPRRNKRPIV